MVKALTSEAVNPCSVLLGTQQCEGQAGYFTCCVTGRDKSVGLSEEYFRTVVTPNCEKPEENAKENNLACY